MEQRRINALVFGFIGALLGVVLAGYAGAANIAQLTAAILVAVGIAALVGWHWSRPAHTRR